MTVEFFAEIGSNHNQDLDRAKRMIDEAGNIGCDGVKFQYFKADKMWDKETYPTHWETIHSRELPRSWLPELSKRAKAHGLLFGVSVFDVESVAHVAPFCDYLKIASFEAGYLDLVREAYKTNLRLMISLGQVYREEITEIIQNLPPQENPIDLLHCVSKYPAKLSECNLGIIRDNRLINGWSDHTRSINAICTAVAIGAKVIEFHMDLDREGVEKGGHCWNVGTAKAMIVIAKEAESAIGDMDWDTFHKVQNLC